MINICVNQPDRQIEIEGIPPIPIANLVHVSECINLIKFVLDKAYHSGERVCLEFRDITGAMHTIERYD